MIKFQSNEKNAPLRFSDPSDRVAKKKKKKAGIISFALSGAMVLGLLSATFLPKPESARAFESLPEIETIKSALTGSGKSLKILEVVNDTEEAVFGYYVEGQEPKELVNDVLLPATTKYPSYNGNAARSQAASDYFGSLNNKALIGYNTGASPISFTQVYTEYYPWEDVPENLVEQGFVHELDTPGETVTASGRYSDEGRGNGAFALTGSSFDVVSSGGEYYQDIVTGETGRGAVLVPASEIKDSDVSDYMFYKVDTVPFYVGTDEDNEAVFYKEEDEESDKEFDLTAYNGKYVFRGSSSSYYGTIGKTTEWIVSGDEREPYFILDTLNSDNERPVSGEALLLDEAKKETVLASDSGWYGISMEVPFEKTDSSSAYPYKVNFNIVPKGFIYKGKGNGQFNIDVTAVSGLPSNVEYASKTNSSTLTTPVTFEDPAPVSYDKVSYSIDVTNNNLFLKYVLDCSDEDASLISSRAKSIQIDAVAATSLSVESVESDFSKRGQHYSIKDYDLIVFENGYASNGDIPDAAREAVLSVALDNEDDSTDEKAMIIDADSDLAKDYLMKKPYSKAEKDAADELTNRASSFISGAAGFSYGYTDGNLFFFKPGTDDRKSIVTSDIKTPFASSFYTTEGSAFYGVINEIKDENVLRERAGSSTLEESVDLGKIMRYILNFKERRQLTPKTSVKILEIEPDNHSELRKSTIAYPDGNEKNNIGGAYPGKTDDFFPFVYDWFGNTYNDDTITLSTMSTYEFVGKIDDITEEYDLVYIGSDITDFYVDTSVVDTVKYPFEVPWPTYLTTCVRDKYDPTSEWGREETTKVPVKNRETRDFYMTNKITTTTPKNTAVPVGIYKSDEEYSKTSKGWYLYDFKYKYKTTYNDTDMNGLVYYNIGDINYSAEGNRAKGLISGDQDWLEVRYSGNDLTEKKLNELLDFANAGYPVVFADNLMKLDASEKWTVNNERVDVNSRMYSFIKTVAGKANTYISTDAARSESSSKLIRQLSLSKPSIDFSFNGGYRPPDYTETKGTNDHNAISDRTLRYTFRILNETDPTPLSTTYSLHLYIDRGADGIFSEDDEVELSSSDLTGGDIDSLKGSIPSSGISNVYTLKRALPDGVKGMVSWKLVVEKNGGGLHASEKGYAYTPVKIKNENGSYSDPININILQINMDKGMANDPYALQWQYETGEGPFGEQFDVLKENGNGNYNLNITTVTTEQENYYYNVLGGPEGFPNPDYAGYDINNGAYDMLIIGFGDAYGELVDKTAEAVVEFIDSGKAVLFSHDNTAPCNSLEFYNSNKSSGHGYYFNIMVRDRVGLDRYGVTNDDTLFSYTNRENQYNVYNVNYKLGGSGWTNIDGTNVGPGVLYNRDSLNSYQIGSIQEAGYDIAYKPSSKISDIGKTDWRAHGFTDLFTEGLKDDRVNGISNINKYSSVNASMTGYPDYQTDIITMENEGQITKYPFDVEGMAVDDIFTNGRSNLQVSTTHQQYYQMNMSSEDLIVWYCLGHEAGDANADLYSVVPNDVANQYYIFTRGNITYSGCGHGGTATHWSDPTPNEAKLFINTMIAAYRAGYAAPDFKFVASSESTDDVKIETVCLPYETAGELYAGEKSASETEENDITNLVGKINFRFTDTNLDAGRTMGLSEFEILLPDPYKTKIYEPADKTYQERTFTHDNFRLMIDEEGHLVFYYKQNGDSDNNFVSKKSEETVRFYDSDGNVVENGKFLSGKVYSLDIQDLVKIFTKYTSRTDENGSQNPYGISEKDHYRAPDTFPTEFKISAKPVTYFANGAKKVAENASTLTVTSLKMFDIG